MFSTDAVLNSIEMELVWLGEESIYCLRAKPPPRLPAHVGFDFDFVWHYASEALRVELRKIGIDDSANIDLWHRPILRDDWAVRKRFDVVREKARFALRQGRRRPSMLRVIADLRLRQRDVAPQDRQFPSLA